MGKPDIKSYRFGIFFNSTTSSLVIYLLILEGQSMGNSMRIFLFLFFLVIVVLLSWDWQFTKRELKLKEEELKLN